MPVYVVDPKPMTHDEIVAAVRRIRYSSKAQRNGRRIPTARALAEQTGLRRGTIYDVVNSGRMSPETADKLRSALSNDSAESDMSGKARD